MENALFRRFVRWKATRGVRSARENFSPLFTEEYGFVGRRGTNRTFIRQQASGEAGARNVFVPIEQIVNRRRFIRRAYTRARKYTPAHGQDGGIGGMYIRI